MKNRYKKGAALLAAYLASIIIAAALVVYVGPVPVGLGLYAPAGAYMIGCTLAFRDLAQDQLGPKATYTAVLVGTALSAIMSPAVALGAAAAFLVSETVDLVVYTPIRARGHLKTAVTVSNMVAILADSAIFLSIAFGSLDYFWGQVWAKTVSTVLVVAVLSWLYRNRADMTPAYIRAKQAAA